MNEFLENLKKQAAANPIIAMGVAASLIAAISKLIDAHGHHVGSAAYSRDVNRRTRQSKR